MKTILLYLSSILLISTGLFVPKNISIFLIGDSTMADKPLVDNPERGWGQLFPAFFNDKVKIENHAKNGRSTKSFIDEGRWDSVMHKVKKGDYVFIQFGHNDEKKEDPKRYAEPHSTYKNNLIKFITESRAKKAVPVLLTPIVRRKFNEKGELVDTHGEYPAVVKEVAKELKVPLIDLNSSSQKLVSELGVEGSKALYLHIEPGKYKSMPNGKKDDTHFSEFGATKMAGLVIDRIKELKLGLVKYLN